jgi:hypothetical protein
LSRALTLIVARQVKDSAGDFRTAGTDTTGLWQLRVKLLKQLAPALDGLSEFIPLQLASAWRSPIGSLRYVTTLKN